MLAADALPPRNRYANKGDNGHVLVIGGEHGMAGAVRLAGESALRTGAGLVSIATRIGHVPALNAGHVPELMAHAALDGLVRRSSNPCLSVPVCWRSGPGWGRPPGAMHCG